MEVESLVKKCGKPKMLDAIKLPPPELYNHVEVCYGYPFFNHLSECFPSVLISHLYFFTVVDVETHSLCGNYHILLFSAI